RWSRPGRPPGPAPRGPKPGVVGAGGAERRQGPVARRTRRGPARCRVCGKTLTDAGEMKLMRCDDCPSDMDEALYERLRDWRSVRAKEIGQPPYCVFTDKTLMAIAEAVPGSAGELAVISGVGTRKLNRFGTAVLAICAGGTGEEQTPDASGEA
ncbi:HRDC domain-containing protein, partial [Streptomyces sp. NPDC001455]|uniref:HRDC domain-containing protein n=1 Tax=Streptomyces sp. NPDC001455 TaxID=3154518 RepID=UPI0033232CAD